MMDEQRLADILHDGMLIATIAVRQAVKNALIVRALRDNDDYDAIAIAGAVHDEFERLATERDEEAARLLELIGSTRRRRGRGRHQSDYRGVDTKVLRDHRLVAVELARRLREAAADATLTAATVDAARRDALDEIVAAAAAPARAQWALSDIERVSELAALAHDLDALLGA